MTLTRLTLLEIHHPAFRKGYQDGRQHYFREKTILTDKHLVEYLQDIFKESEKDEANDREEGVYYAIGHLTGQMSGCVIARQPHEDNTRDLQEAFLLKVRHMHGADGQALVDTIGQFWTMQDQLAMTLDADSFGQMLGRGAEQRSL
jgi:hypothetical protein